MRTLLSLTLFAGLGLAQNTPLTEVERLKLENASLKLSAIEQQKADIQKQAQAVFESACTRAGIDLASCQFDQATASVKKAEPVKEVKK